MNNMDRRSFLAFILSMMLFAGFYWYYAPRVSKRQKLAKKEAAVEQAADSAAAGRPPVNTASTPVPQPPPRDSSGGGLTGILPAADAGKAEVIIIDTPLYRAEISTAGAEIVTFELKKYLTDGKPVELLVHMPDSSIGPKGIGDMELIGKTSSLPLSGVLFDAFLPGYSEALAGGTEIALDENKPEGSLVMRARAANGALMERSFSFRADSYVFETGISYNPADFPFAEKISWGMGRGLLPTEKNIRDDFMNFQGSARLGETISRVKPKNFSKTKTKSHAGTLGWITLQTKYFTACMIPPVPVVDAEYEFRGDKGSNYITGRMKLPAPAGRDRVRQNIAVYIGPLDFKRLKALDAGLEKNINMGYKFIRPVSWLILWSLIALYKVIPNYGIVIIILSVFTKILFYRLTHKSFKSMKEMQNLQPKLQALKEKYKDDKQKISAETMKMYKEHGVNPLGGCLPMLLQAPVFIALFSVLKFTIEVRGAHFMLWIRDLSQQDVLATLPVALPAIGSEVSLLPILMGVAMLVQTKIGGSITGSSPGASQSKAFSYMMPVVFTFIFYKMPSGLVLYWFVNNILSIAQQYYINKDTGEEKTDNMGKKEPGKKSGKSPVKRKER